MKPSGNVLLPQKPVMLTGTLRLVTKVMSLIVRTCRSSTVGSPCVKYGSLAAAGSVPSAGRVHTS